MKRIGIRCTMLFLVIGFLLLCAVSFGLDYAKNRKQWLFHPANPNVYQNGRLIGNGTIRSADQTLLYEIPEDKTPYADNKTLRKATLHAVGDTGNNIRTGMRWLHPDQLIGYDLLSGVYDPFPQGNTLTLTLSAKLSTTAYQAMGDDNGTIGVYNYKTGEVLCMVSKPSFDPHKLPDLTKPAYDGVYLNRLVQGLYVPGSIFKLVTTMAALKHLPDAQTRTFTCTGGITIGGEYVKCSGKHGKVTLAEALAHSCNVAYGQLGVELGAEKLTAAAKQAGVLDSFSVEGVDVTRGRMTLQNATENDLAWAAIGQHTTMVNPMQYLTLMGAIANEGVAVRPYYLDQVTTFYGRPTKLRAPTLLRRSRLMEAEMASELTQLMRNNAVTSYRDDQFAGMNLCAKTGTAQVDGKQPHSWFVGFLDNEESPLAFVVLLEHAGGSQKAIRTAKTVLQEAVK